MYRLILFCAVLQMNAAQRNPSVIIVGAGPAGIAAAAKLLENSITNITILEAENRIGGRIHSVEFGSGFVDVGAQFCHGEKGNAVYEMVKDLGLLEPSFSLDVSSGKIYYSNGSTIEQQLTLELFSTVTDYTDELNETAGVSLGEAFLSKYNATVLRRHSGDEEKLKITTEAIKLLHDSIMMHEGSYSWAQPSAGRHYKDCDGDQGLGWKSGGYHTVLNVLMKGYPNPSEKLPIDEKTNLNKTVTKIQWKGSTVKVESSDNTVLTADYVIFTPSIGVLKAHRNSLFEPELPQRKQKAIEAIGFNGVMKIILHFPQRWWNEQDKVFLFIWSKEHLLNIKNEFSDGPEKNGLPWVSQILGVVAVPHNPKVLIAWLAGDILPQVEETSEEVVTAGCMYAVKKFLSKDYNITDADKIIRSTWITNPNFRGTYSYERVEYFEENVSYQQQLSEPLMRDENHPAVLFAGEATHPTLYSTVHGAIESGRREAERVINLAKKGIN